MNPRIKELWNEAAKLEADPSWEGQTRFMEKFAELLLKRAMSICEDLGDQGMDGHYCVDKIRREFGL
jgi:hypothetical protein